jgi:hypothetical protein
MLSSVELVQPVAISMMIAPKNAIDDHEHRVPTFNYSLLCSKTFILEMTRSTTNADAEIDDEERKSSLFEFVPVCNRTTVTYITEPWDNLHHRRSPPRSLNRVPLAQLSHPNYKVRHVNGPSQKGHNIK